MEKEGLYADDVFYWWLGSEQSNLFALRGEYGVGKTFQLRHWWELCREEKFRRKFQDQFGRKVPVPYYIDLKNYLTRFGIPDFKETIRQSWKEYAQEEFDEREVGEIIQSVKKGSMMFFVDHFEVLECLEFPEGRRWFKDLLRASPYCSKSVIAFRKEYFPDDKSMNLFFCGFQEDGFELCMRLAELPLFNKAQILEFLRKRLCPNAPRVLRCNPTPEQLASMPSADKLLRQGMEEILRRRKTGWK